MSLKTIAFRFAVIGFVIASCSSPLQPTPPINSLGFEPGLQTHFATPIGLGLLTEVRALGFKVARIDAQAADYAASMAMIEETQQAGMRPLVIVRRAEQLLELPEGLDYELVNEPDLNGPAPSEYIPLMLRAAELAKSRSQMLWVGSISNLNARGFAYINAIAGSIPPGVGVSVHRYHDNTFEEPHSGFDNRDREVHWLKAAIGSRRFIVTEFGFQSAQGTTEEEQADRVRAEWRFWAGHGPEIVVLYQINDGHHDKFGIRNINGDWKPSAYTLENQ